MAYRFEEFEIDFQLYELRRGGERVRIDRKVFDLLRYLIDHRERVVSKEELLREVWRGETVVDAVVPTAVARLRKALGQSGSRGGPIETAHGRGYRFICRISTSPPRAEQGAQGLALDTDLHPGLRDPFVGRESIMQRLAGAFEKAMNGQSRVRLLIGEPGIGKTRITFEFAARARAAGAQVLTGRCHEADRDTKLWAFTQVLRSLLDEGEDSVLRQLSPTTRRRLAALVPELQSSQVGAEHGEPVTQLQSFDAVAQLLRAAARTRGRVIIIDDLHWADDPSLALLSFLATELTDLKLMVLATFREAELPPEHPHWAALDLMERAPSVKRVYVTPLTFEDVDHYLEAFTGQSPQSELVARVHAQTAGNAFFVRETVRSLTWDALKEGHLDLSSVVLPASARDVVRRRVAVLGPEVCGVLDAASAIGEQFELPLLQRILSFTPDALLDALDCAERARLVTRVAQGGEASDAGTYAFAHTLLQETIYGDLSSTERCELHGRIGEALEAERGVRPGVTVEIAHHLHRALPHADGDKVLEYGVRAAERAHERQDHEDEARWYARAYDGLRYAREADPDRGAELMLAQGRALRESGKPAQAREALSRVIELATLGKASAHWADAARNEIARLVDGA